jgi:hypothetical protein
MELTSNIPFPGLPASMPQLFSLIQQKKETERKQKLAVTEALLIGKTWDVYGSGLH